MSRYIARGQLLAAFILGAATLAVRAQSPATFLVGSDPVCDYATIQQAVDAAASLPGEDFIHVARNGTYVAQAIKIGGQDLEIIGGFDTCDDAVAEGGTTISGEGGAADSVVQIRGGGMRRLRNLGIVGGDEGNDDHGGGIDYKGHGAVELINVAVIGNRAGYGGGISIDNEGGTAVLELKAPTVVNGNTAAHDGGGIHLKGTSLFFMIETQTMIGGNHAPNGMGGGIFAQGPATARVASPGYNGAGAISDNDARDGGGIALRGNDFDNILMDVYAGDPVAPVRLASNTASSRGGAIYGRGNSTAFLNSATFGLEMTNVVIEGNRAAFGAALYLDSEFDGIANEQGGYANLNIREDDVARCAQGLACNAVRGNVVTSADGAVVQLDSSTSFRATGTAFVGNSGASLVKLTGDSGYSSSAAFNDSLLADNNATQQLLRATGEEDGLRLFRTTIAHNTIGAQHVAGFAASDGHFNLTESIVDQPGRLTLQHPGGVNDADVSVHRVITNDFSTLPITDNVFEAPGRFVDPANGDYRLRAGSPAVDFAPPVSGNQFDLAGKARDQEYGIRPDFLGTRDLGAYEHQPVSNLVLNDRFASDLRIWRDLEPDWTSWNADSNDAGSGSLEINVPGLSGLDAVTGLSQCIHLPGPGTYTLDGRGNAGSLGGLFRDQLSLEWVLRDNGDTCEGPALGQGELFIRSGTGWRSPLEPATFVVPPGVWGINTTIELRLKVRQNPSNPASISLFGRFDNLSLTASGAIADELLIDGFE
jgi:predicted outer membrane repeat protein